MRTVRRLLYRQILSTVLYVAVAFMALFFFVDFVDVVQDVGEHGYTLLDAIWTCLLLQPNHVYDMFPIALLIGATLALAQLAQSSEFTILRTAGLGPGRALSLLVVLGLGAAIFLFALGEWLVPVAQQQATLHGAQFSKGKSLKLGRGGAWLRERYEVPGQAPRTVTVNVGAAEGHNDLRQVRIFEFDDQGRLLRRLGAARAQVESIEGGARSIWHLQEVRDTQWQPHIERPNEPQSLEDSGVTEQQLDKLEWRSSLTPLVVTASVLPADTMSTVALWRYTRHLSDNAQAVQRYELQFWKRAFAPLVCFVMLGLALPFAYLHARAGGMNLKVFGGIMLGISFVLVNHIAGHLAMLHQWEPWLATLIPSLAYLLLSLSAFVWLVRNR